MAGLHDVIGLLYRADWTRLSLSADVRFEKDGDLARRREKAIMAEMARFIGYDPGAWGGRSVDEEPILEPEGYHRWRADLLIAPGGRYRLDYGGDYGGRTEGRDGEQVWTLASPAAAIPPSHLPRADGETPVPDLFRPAGLLAGCTLEVRGPATACGRAAIAVTATPRPGGSGSITSVFGRPRGPVELLVDAETGILLRREETFEGQLLTLAELTTLTMGPPEADDLARFAPPAGSRPGRDSRKHETPDRSGPGWDAVKNAANLAAAGLGAWIRLSPHLTGHDQADADRVEAAMPSPEPDPLGPGERAPVSDDLLGLLYRSGLDDGAEPVVRDVVMRRWTRTGPMPAEVPDSARAAGLGGVGYLLDSMGRKEAVTLTTARLRVGGPDLYHIDYTYRPSRAGLVAVACDGQQRWQVYEHATLVGPPAPLMSDIWNLTGSSWLLGKHLSGGAEVTYHGRRGYHLRVTRGDGELPAGPVTNTPYDAIVDAETGCLLRLIAYDNDAPTNWWELDHITMGPGGPADPASFRPDLPPGTRLVETSGQPIADIFAATPGLTGTAARAATEAVRRTAGAVSAARGFLDDLRGGHR
jgi:outer membrane lipoprotein-sorting protein